MAIERKFRVIYPDNFNFQKVYREAMENLPVEISIVEIDPPSEKSIWDQFFPNRKMTDLDIRKYRELLAGGRRWGTIRERESFCKPFTLALEKSGAGKQYFSIHFIYDPDIHFIFQYSNLLFQLKCHVF